MAIIEGIPHFQTYPDSELGPGVQWEQIARKIGTNSLTEKLYSYTAENLFYGWSHKRILHQWRFK